tara:strand:+ start:211 stop:708 length:498 start_codon:yes stop_codon:yes gene_type:complete
MISYLINDAKFWTAIAFVLFIILTFKPVKLILLKNLDEKIKLIITRIDEAKKIEKDAEILLQNIKDKEKNLSSTISSLKQETNNIIHNLNKEIEKKIEYQINLKKNLAELKIKQLEQEAISEIKNKTTYHTIEAVKNIMKARIDITKHEDLIDLSLKDLNNLSKN